MTVYLDHAARSPLRPNARSAWLEAQELYGNASSLHGAGRAARAALEDARERIAGLLGAHPTEVVFTSGATEAANAAIKGTVWAAKTDVPPRVLTTAVEHHATLDAARWLAQTGQAEIAELGVDADARLVLEEVAQALALPRTRLLAMQWVNNEVGTVQPLDQVVRAATEAGVAVFADLVQGIGHLPFDFARSGLMAASVSAHKVGGPVGVGALLVTRGAPISPLTHGGGQERRLRSGTVDVAGASAFAAALDDAVLARASQASRLISMATRLERALREAAPDATVHGPSTGGAPHIVHAIVPGAPSEAMLLGLDRAGIDASPGAACTAGVIESSHVVLAMGHGQRDAGCTVRFSLGWTTTDADVDAAISALPSAIAAARSWS